MACSYCFGLYALLNGLNRILRVSQLAGEHGSTLLPMRRGHTPVGSACTTN